VASDRVGPGGEDLVFELVVTDIQMPRMNGFELCERIKRDPRTRHLPVIALTSLAGDEDIQRGRECGVDDYQVKMDREKLLQSVDQLRLHRSGEVARPAPVVAPTPVAMPLAAATC
ncbi:MAG: response regulator, partial [Pirellulales bacterium]|nr:response regulator [Pirellulales bacterium]